MPQKQRCGGVCFPAVVHLLQPGWCARSWMMLVGILQQMAPASCWCLDPQAPQCAQNARGRRQRRRRLCRDRFQQCVALAVAAASESPRSPPQTLSKQQRGKPNQEEEQLCVVGEAQQQAQHTPKHHSLTNSQEHQPHPALSKLGRFMGSNNNNNNKKKKQQTKQLDTRLSQLQKEHNR